MLAKLKMNQMRYRLFYFKVSLTSRVLHTRLAPMVGSTSLSQMHQPLWESANAPKGTVHLNLKFAFLNFHLLDFGLIILQFLFSSQCLLNFTQFF